MNLRRSAASGLAASRCCLRGSLCAASDGSRRRTFHRVKALQAAKLPKHHLVFAVEARDLHVRDFFDSVEPVDSSPAIDPAGGAVASSCPGWRETRFKSIAAPGVGISTVVANHLLVGVGDVGRHLSGPIQCIQGAGDSLVGAVLDLSGFRLALESRPAATFPRHPLPATVRSALIRESRVQNPAQLSRGHRIVAGAGRDRVVTSTLAESAVQPY